MTSVITYSDAFCRKNHDQQERIRYNQTPKKPCWHYYYTSNGCKHGAKCFNSHSYEWVPKEISVKLKEEKEALEKENEELKKDIVEREKQISSFQTQIQKNKDSKIDKFDMNELLLEAHCHNVDFLEHACEILNLPNEYVCYVPHIFHGSIQQVTGQRSQHKKQC